MTGRTMYVQTESASAAWHAASTSGAPFAAEAAIALHDVVERPAIGTSLPTSDLFAVIAHEIRGPLHALVTSSEILTDTLAEQAGEATRAHELAVAVHCRSIWLQGLVENLLCAATIQHGRFALHRQAMSVMDVLAEISVVVEPLLAQRGQRLRVRSFTPLPVVDADRHRIGQVLMNLILNASKFSPAESVISVIVSRVGDAITVTVADRGPGIPPEGAEALFQPYVRGAQEGRREGVGLGLAIVKAIVDAHGGIAGAARRPSGGSRFWVTLPATVTLPRAC